MSDKYQSLIEGVKTLTGDAKSLFELKSKWLTVVIIILQLFAVVWNVIKPPKEIFPNVLILILLFALLGLLATQEYRYSRKAKYAEALFFIHSIVHRLRDNFHTLNKISNSSEDAESILKRKVFEEAEKVITSFANAFNLITGTRCRACIKLINNAEPSKKYSELSKEEKERVLYVETWVRDIDTKLLETKEEPMHWLCGNTDFSELFSAKNPTINNSFFENNLPKRRNYLNTSFELYTEPNGRWKLPYKSTIVWPIRKITSDQYDREEGQFTEKQDILGYLCIDSKARKIFNKSYDVNFGAIVADSIFIFLRRYYMVLNKKRKEN
ncbi:MAG: hypothetical protein U0586_08720 [Candidatus Brocadiaceae bacterium]